MSPRGPQGWHGGGSAAWRSLLLSQPAALTNFKGFSVARGPRIELLTWLLPFEQKPQIAETLIHSAVQGALK